MKTEERLATLVRGVVEAEVRDVAPAPELATRVIAGRKGRRRARLRVHLAVAVACVATTAAAGAVPLVLERDDSPGTIAKPFDANKSVKIGYIPDGMVKDDGSPVAADGFNRGVSPRQKGSGIVWWSIAYRTRDTVPGRPTALFSVHLATGPIPRDDTWIRESGLKLVRAIQVPSGKAHLARLDEPSRPVTLVIRWDVRPGLLLFMDALSFPEAETLKIFRGITIAE